jgi:hypothetical protein
VDSNTADSHLPKSKQGRGGLHPPPPSRQREPHTSFRGEVQRTTVLKITFCCTLILRREKFSLLLFIFLFYQRPQRPYSPPLWGPRWPLPAPRLPLCGPVGPPLAGCPPLYDGFELPKPLPRCVTGSCPESHCGGGHGLGVGGGGSCPFALSFFPAAAEVGMTDSSQALLVTGSPPCPPLARSAMSFLAATLVALEVR